VAEQLLVLANPTTMIGELLPIPGLRLLERVVVEIAGHDLVEVLHLQGILGTLTRPPKLLLLEEMMIGVRLPLHLEQHRDLGMILILDLFILKCVLCNCFRLIL
jgi:hypothetical protein